MQGLFRRLRRHVVDQFEEVPVIALPLASCLISDGQDLREIRILGGRHRNVRALVCTRLVLGVLLLYPLVGVLQHCHQAAVALAHLVSGGGGRPVGGSVGTDPLDPMLPAGLEELLEADPLDRSIIVYLQPLP